MAVELGLLAERVIITEEGRGKGQDNVKDLLPVLSFIQQGPQKVEVWAGALKFLRTFHTKS